MAPASIASIAAVSGVWAELQDRNDIAIILREIIGRHALYDVFHEDEGQTSHETGYQTIIWIKIIYDLQGCYLSGITAGMLNPSQTLERELLFSSILYLISAKLRTFPSQTTLIGDHGDALAHDIGRLILAQTVLSGLRLLLLRKDQIPPNQIRSLQAALNQGWRDDHLRGVERCIVQQIFAAILDIIHEPDHVDAYRVERENARLPAYATGLVCLRAHMENMANLPSIPWT